MKIVVKTVKAKHLMPGDLFSMVPKEVWDLGMAINSKPIGLKVNIRTEVDCPEDEKDNEVLLIKIETGKLQ